MRGETSKAVFFVDLVSVEQATAIIEALDGRLLQIGEDLVHVERAVYATPSSLENASATSQLYIPYIPEARNLDELEPLFGNLQGFQKIVVGA